MIDTVLNLLFRCPHKRMTRPITPASKGGVAHGDTYVVCLDCGKQFSYDLDRMRIVKRVSNSPGAGVLPPNMPKPRKSKMRHAVWALPLAWIIGAALKKPRDDREGGGKGNSVR